MNVSSPGILLTAHAVTDFCQVSQNRNSAFIVQVETSAARGQQPPHCGLALVRSQEMFATDNVRLPMMQLATVVRINRSSVSELRSSAPLTAAM